MEAKQQGIQVRMRGDLAHTLKDGWRVSETSVTVEFLIATDEGYEIDMDLERHADLAKQAHRHMYTYLLSEAEWRQKEVGDAKRSPDRPE